MIRARGQVAELIAHLTEPQSAPAAS
jgi:hypothetical protein